MLNLLKKTKHKTVYLLDASAILNNPDIASYYNFYQEQYKINKKENAFFLLTALCLKEIDNIKSKERANHNTFYEFLRKNLLVKGKLSNGVKFGKDTYYLYCDDLLPLAKAGKYKHMDSNYGDTQLISLAIQLKSEVNDIIVFTADVLLQVLLHEENIKSVYVRRGEVISGEGSITRSGMSGPFVEIKTAKPVLNDKISID